ncbi:BspA family leucine-rich repeat surface protein [Bifidobacterium sp. ESL0732]|uniref:BspA family leucine-rich repeat surface protein n=1 Tax=Bifidobacterium sp. ESL0732 TaxID=2983222 RepID=UPI0023F8A0D8|nr:BspA family leucine-rich repeat surface protein [Bifidobacterium sp. ESL0732]
MAAAILATPTLSQAEEIQRSHPEDQTQTSLQAPADSKDTSKDINNAGTPTPVPAHAPVPTKTNSEGKLGDDNNKASSTTPKAPTTSEEQKTANQVGLPAAQSSIPQSAQPTVRDASCDRMIEKTGATWTLSQTGNECTIIINTTVPGAEFDVTGFKGLPERTSITSVAFEGAMTKLPADSSNTFGGTSGFDAAMASLKSVTGLDKIDTSGVTNMGHMFAGCNKLTNLDLSSWNTSSTTNMNSMFSMGSELTNLNISSWNTNKVTDMSLMFNNCSKLTSLDLSSWDTSSVTNMNSMFSGCSKLSDLNLRDTLITGKVTDMSSMFNSCYKLGILNTDKWDTSNVTDMSSLFNDCRNLTQLDTSNWKTDKVIYMNSLFNNCRNIGTLDVSGWKTDKVTSMSQMFSQCWALANIDVSGWNTENVTSMNNMFSYCYEFTRLNVSGWKTGNVTDMTSTFYGLSKLTTLDVSDWDTGNVTDMTTTFGGCSGLTSLNVKKWNTSKVEKMTTTFGGCAGLTSLDLGSWDTRNVKNINSAFIGCTNLTSLDLSNWDTHNVTSNNTAFVFDGCTSLSQLSIGENTKLADDSYLTDASAAEPTDDTYTGSWIQLAVPSTPSANVDQTKTYTAEELLTRSRGNDGNRAGTYVWQQQRTLTADAKAPEGTHTDGDSSKVVATVKGGIGTNVPAYNADGTLRKTFPTLIAPFPVVAVPENPFTLLDSKNKESKDYTFKHWTANGDIENPGDSIDLTDGNRTIEAVWNHIDHSDTPSTPEPGKPTTPDKPGKPDNPGTPDKPGNPSNPDTPDKPGNPDKPGKPDTPNRPSTPDKPGTSGNAVTPTNPGLPGNPAPAITPSVPTLQPGISAFAPTLRVVPGINNGGNQTTGNGGHDSSANGNAPRVLGQQKKKEPCIPASYRLSDGTSAIAEICTHDNSEPTAAHYDGLRQMPLWMLLLWLLLTFFILFLLAHRQNFEVVRHRSVEETH